MAIIDLQKISAAHGMQAPTCPECGCGLKEDATPDNKHTRWWQLLYRKVIRGYTCTCCGRRYRLSRN